MAARTVCSSVAAAYPEPRRRGARQTLRAAARTTRTRGRGRCGAPKPRRMVLSQGSGSVSVAPRGLGCGGGPLLSPPPSVLDTQPPMARARARRATAPGRRAGCRAADGTAAAAAAQERRSRTRALAAVSGTIRTTRAVCLCGVAGGARLKNCAPRPDAVMEPDGAPALGGAAASLGAVLLAAACGMTPAPGAGDGNKENGVLCASTRGNAAALAAPSALKAEASAAAAGRAPGALAAEDSYDTAGCARHAGAAHAGCHCHVHRGGARHCGAFAARAALRSAERGYGNGTVVPARRG